MDKNTRTKSITSKQTIRDIVKDINNQQAFSPELVDTSQSESELSAVTNRPATSGCSVTTTENQTSVVFSATEDDSMFDAITPMTQMSLADSPVSNRTDASNKTAKTIVKQNQEDTQSSITSDDNTNVSQ